jgi:hypothetical protein
VKLASLQSAINSRPPGEAAERIFLLAFVRLSRCVEGFDDIVTCTVAPTGTGWNDSCRAGFAPAEDATPLHRALFFDQSG